MVSMPSSALGYRHLIVALLIMLFNQGCGIIRPDPVSLYPDDPSFDPNEAALINLLLKEPGETGVETGWQGVSIVPEEFRANRGSQRDLKTWVILVPPGSYMLSIDHPYRNYESTVVVDNVTINLGTSVVVEISAKLEAGKYYRIVYVDKPGYADFELWETTEKEARGFNLNATVQPKNTFDATVRPREGR